MGEQQGDKRGPGAPEPQNSARRGHPDGGKAGSVKGTYQRSGSIRDVLHAQIDLGKSLRAYGSWASERVPAIDRRSGLPQWAPIAAFFLFALLIGTRWPCALTGPPLVADDGKIFEAAWNHGWASLGMPYGGYLNVVPGLVFLVAVRLPLDAAPILITWVAIAIQAAVAAAMLSKRVAAILPSELSRVALAFLLVAYPSCNGILGNVTHSQWFMAVWGLVVILTPRPSSTVALAWDIVFLLLTSLSGPFGILLLPFALWKWRERWLPALVLVPGSLYQIHLVLGSGRMVSPGHHRLATVSGMLANKVYGAALSYPPDDQYSAFFDFGEIVCALVVLALVGVILWRGPTLLKALAALASTCFVLALNSGSTWYALGTLGKGERYFFLLGISFAMGLVYLAQLPSWRLPRLCLHMAVVLFAFSIVNGWRTRDYAGPSYGAAYRAAEPGVVSIPIASPDGFWTMELKKPPP